MLLLAIGAAAVAVGAGLVYLPAGVIVAGASAAGVGLLWDDGKPKK